MRLLGVLRLVAVVAVAVVAVVALARTNPRYAFDEDAARARLDERAGLTADEVDDLVDGVRDICTTRGLDEFEAKLAAWVHEAGNTYNDVVVGCPQRFD